MKVLTLALCFLLAGITTLARGQTAPYRTEYVFIVAIDGLRYTEGFDAGRRYLPCLWDSLRPQGTMYTNFVNTGITVTNAGHSTIVTGVRQLLLNNLYVNTLIRPKDPTLAEYYRKAFGLPAEKVCFISGKNTIWRYPVSVFPGYGPEFAPKIVLASRNDYETWDSTRAIIDRYHPSLCYVLFAQVDEEGHTGDTTLYMRSIPRADSLVNQLWKKIQSDSVYANKTTMIVTSDHGRHDDQHGGWRDHGDFCRGCRHITFLAIGPDIKRNTVIARTRDQIDIAPTVGRLLGLSTPLAQGEVMTEMLVSAGVQGPAASGQSTHRSAEVSISATNGVSRSSAIARNRGGIHVVFSDNSTGRTEILYTRSTDRGTSWTTPEVLLTDLRGDILDPAITAYGDDGLYVVATGYTYPADDSTSLWLLRGRRSTDSGRTWLGDVIVQQMTGMSCKPAISSSRQQINALGMDYFTIKNNQSRDGGATFAPPNLVTLGGYMPTIACTTIDTTCFATWHNLYNSSPRWNIWFNRQPWMPDNFQMTNNGDNSFSYDPHLSVDSSGVLHTVYAHLSNAPSGNQWQVYYRRSPDRGTTWSSAQSISGTGSIAPIIKTSDNGKLVALWSAYANNQWEIRGSYSVNGGTTWMAPFSVTAPQSFSLEPDFSASGDTLYVVWRDWRSGNSEIFFRTFRLGVTDAGKTEHNAPSRFSLGQNFPNPCNPTTTIQYRIANSDDATLKVFDLLGREIATLVTGIHRAGEYATTFDASNLPTGVYFYRLQSGANMELRKLIVLK